MQLHSDLFKWAKIETVQGRNIWCFSVSGIKTPSLFYGRCQPDGWSSGPASSCASPPLRGSAGSPRHWAAAAGTGLAWDAQVRHCIFWSSWAKPLFEIYCSLQSWLRRGCISIGPLVRCDSSPGSPSGSWIPLWTALPAVTLSQVL